jgi:hypothetical protein
MMSGSARRYVRKEGGREGGKERVGRMEERRGKGRGLIVGGRQLYIGVCDGNGRRSEDWKEGEGRQDMWQCRRGRKEGSA